MYGFIHCALADMVLKNYGEAQWKEILKLTGIELGGGSFLNHSIYTDEETFSLVSATCDILGMTKDDCLEAFGRHFLAYCFDSGYDGILRVLGETLLDFLRNLDALHDHLASIYPGMSAPAFRCELHDEGHILLHYHSERSGLHAIVIGLVKSVATELYHTQVEVSVISQEICDNKTHVVILVKEKEGCKSRKRINSFSGHIQFETESKDPCDSLISVDFFCQAFPFHIMFDGNLNITQAGVALLCHLKKRNLVPPYNVDDLFELDRPVIELSFSNILSHVDNLFVLVLKQPLTVPEAATEETAKCLRLKGQMMYVPESRNMLYLCSPRVKSLNELKGQNMYLSDIPLHDKTRELLLVQDAGWMERELVEKLEETSNNLKKLQVKLKEDQEKTDSLLHSILPTTVAERLRRHENVEADKFDMVTVLYSDVVDFTALCGNEAVQPMDIIRLLNRLYSEFDMLVTTYGVYKVETIGDAYMLACGVPEFVQDHADRVLDTALGMMAASQHVMLPTGGNHIQIRMGVNSGPCISGVVGWKMPRYCLFGNTVFIASRMESYSLSGKINISDSTRRCLTNTSKYSFHENFSKANISCKCYFVKTKGAASHVFIAPATPTMPGLFCSPCPSPAGSRRPSTELSLINIPVQTSLDQQTMSFDVPDTQGLQEDRRATIGAKIQYYSHVEAMLRQKLGDAPREGRREIQRSSTPLPFGTHLNEPRNSRLTLPNVHLHRRCASAERIGGHDLLGIALPHSSRRGQTLGNNVDAPNGEFDLTLESDSPEQTLSIICPFRAAYIKPPVVIHLTPPTTRRFNREESEEAYEFETDRTDVSDLALNRSPGSPPKDFSIFTLPKIQETLKTKLQAVYQERHSGEGGCPNDGLITKTESEQVQLSDEKGPEISVIDTMSENETTVYMV